MKPGTKILDKCERFLETYFTIVIITIVKRGKLLLKSLRLRWKIQAVTNTQNLMQWYNKKCQTLREGIKWKVMVLTNTSSLHQCNNYSSVMLKVSGKGVSLRVINTLAYYNAELPEYKVSYRLPRHPFSMHSLIFKKTRNFFFRFWCWFFVKNLPKFKWTFSPF